MRRLSAITLCVFIGWVFPAGADPATRPAAIKLTVIGTNDFHGALDARRGKMVDGREIGGMDYIAAYFNAVRRDNPHGLLILDGGDLYQGTLLSAASEGRAVIEFYNDLKYAASSIGNHDFDFGPVGYRSTPSKPGEDPLGVIKKRIKQAHFPFLGANLFDRATGKPPDWPGFAQYTIIERKGIKIGIIGLLAVDTGLTTHPANVKGLEFRPLLPSLRRVLPQVRKKGATVIVVVAHSGLKLDEKTGLVKGPLADLIHQLKPHEVDLIVGGHNHIPYTGIVSGVVVLQSWAHGVSFGRAELFVDEKTHRVIPGKTRVYDNTFYLHKNEDGSDLEFMGVRIEPVKSFTNKLHAFAHAVAHLERIRLGRSACELPNQTKLDSPVGNLVTDAMRASDPEIAIAMYNSGGLRTFIPAGVVTFGRIYEVVPFDNSLVKVTLSGKQIREILEHGLSASYGIMEISGLKVEFDPDRKPGQRCVSITTENGPLEDDRLYVVGTNEFLINGGDGYYTFAHGRDVKFTHNLIRELVAQYIKHKGTVQPEMGGRYRPAKQQCGGVP